MTNYELIRTNSDHPDFKKLSSKLDAFTKMMDGEEHVFYAQYNRIDGLQNCLVLYIDHLPVAIGAVKIFNETTAEIKRMFVEELYRGNDFGSKILQELETWAKELGLEKCILETGKNFVSAQKLYLKNQYTLIPNYGQYKGVINSFCLEKTL